MLLVIKNIVFKFVQEAVLQCVHRLSEQQPDIRVGLITFNHQVHTWLSGSFYHIFCLILLTYLFLCFKFVSESYLISQFLCCCFSSPYVCVAR